MKKILLISCLLTMILFTACGKSLKENRKVEDYEDLHDVTKLIDLCSEFSFVDMDNLYMMGISRGGMMTYMAAREDSRIKKAVVVFGYSRLLYELGRKRGHAGSIPWFNRQNTG